MIAEFQKVVMLFLKILHSPVFGFSWIVIGLILIIATLVIPHRECKSALVVKTIGYTLAACFIVPGIVALCVSL